MNSLFTFLEVKETLGCNTIGFRDGFVTEVVIDSRKIKEGSLFIPLVGENTDGNLYIESALKSGCKSSLVSFSYFNKEKAKLELLSAEYRATFFVVNDCLLALQDLAAKHIKRFNKLVIIAITGSSGKTTTKEVLGSIIKSHRPTLVTEGNYNSETGLPLTVFRIGLEHEYAVLEMGMSRPGEIKALVNVINPDLSIITNIGSAHIGFFGSRDGIACEKKMAFSNFDGHNTGIIPKWDDFYNFLKQDVNGNILTVNDDPDYITEIKNLGFDGWKFLYEGIEVHYPYMGRYNLLNAFMAISCARELGIPSKAMVTGLEHLPSMFGRGEIILGKNRVIRDCYNANPDSTLSSLELLKNTHWDGDKIPILGSMLELGDSSFNEHKKIALYAVQNFSNVIFYGSEFENVYNLLDEKLGTFYYKDMDELKSAVEVDIKPGTLVLLKASRGVRLEELTASLI